MADRGETIHVVLPGPLDRLSGGTRYVLAVVREMRHLGRDVIVHDLPGAFPIVDRMACDAAEALVDRLGPPAAGPVSIDGPVLIDGLGLPAFLPEMLARLGAIALVHHPLPDEDGLAKDRAEALRRIEGEALIACRGCVATSAATRRRLAALYGLDRARVQVVPPGVAPIFRSPPRRRIPGPVRLLAVGAAIPRKDHHGLVQVMRLVRRRSRRDWRLTIVGDMTAHPPSARRLRRAATALGRTGRIELAGAVAEARLRTLYRQADVFVSASRYEGYGMACAEALARGLPLVGTTGGAIPDTVPRKAGLLVRPGDRSGLAAAILSLIVRPQRRWTLARAAAASGRRLPDWAHAARAMLAALDSICAGR